MKLLQRRYLFGMLQYSFIKWIYSSIVYKIFIRFNYNYFFYLKFLIIKNFYYRFFLVSVNFNFFFFDYIYLINYFSQLNKTELILCSLPTKIKVYSMLRSPFVYSKSKEHFSVSYCHMFFDTKLLKFSDIYFSFLEESFSKIQLYNSKFWYRSIIKS